MARIVTVALGIALMAAPDLVGYEGPARVLHLVVGPIAAAVGAISWSQATRGLRWAGVALGGALVGATPFLPQPPLAAAGAIGAGVLLTALAFVPGRFLELQGGGWRALVEGSREEPAAPTAGAAT